jgi:phospholipid transport system substrate-binding protein
MPEARRHKYVLDTFLFLLLAVPLFQISHATVEPKTTKTPASVVSRFDQSLLATMKAGETAGMLKRCAIMRSAVRSSFGLPFISRLVLGHYWSSFTPAQQTRFMHLFSHLVAATYAYNFNGYGGQEIKIDRSLVRGNNAYVYTTFFTPGHGHRHQFDYVLHHSGSRWLIVNIVADGVSDMAIRRSEYQAFLHHGSVAALLHAIQHQYKMLLEMGIRGNR